MSELENALKNALAKGNASDPEFRQRVYRAAATALERTLAARAGSDTVALSTQMDKLTVAIREMEASYRQSPPQVVPPPAKTTEAPLPQQTAPEIQTEPRRKSERAPELKAEPRTDADSVDTGPVGVERDERNHRRKASRKKKSAIRRAPFATMLTLLVTLGFVMVGGWWVYSTGAFQTAAERDTSVPNPPRQLDEGSFAPALVSGGAQEEDTWIVLFDPTDPSTISLQGAAIANIDSDSFGPFARVLSPGKADIIGIEIPASALVKLTGRTAQFSLTARSEEDETTQMSVTCDFVELGDCGRLRFNVTQTENEFLFSVDIPAGANVSDGGRLKINTDIEGSGRAVRLSSIRLRELAP